VGVPPDLEAVSAAAHSRPAAEWASRLALEAAVEAAVVADPVARWVAKNRAEARWPDRSLVAAAAAAEPYAGRNHAQPRSSRKRSA